MLEVPSMIHQVGGPHQMHWPPHILNALATHSFENTGHPHIIIIIKAASHPFAS